VLWLRLCRAAVTLYPISSSTASATPVVSTLSLHDALPIYPRQPLPPPPMLLPAGKPHPTAPPCAPPVPVHRAHGYPWRSAAYSRGCPWRHSRPLRGCPPPSFSAIDWPSPDGSNCTPLRCRNSDRHQASPPE